MKEKLERLQKNLGYRFKDISLLETALTHSSYANERSEKTAYNERLEFLGDSVLGFVSAGYFYQNFDMPEGELTKHRAAKVCEKALLAAIYLDGGLDEASKLVLRFIPRHDELDNAKDYKTTLQEIIQRNREERLEYVVTDSSGPDHAKTFTVEVHLNSNVIGKGTGKSKKLAEQFAAKEALELMGIK